MRLLEKILLATDFSESSSTLVRNAIGLAKQFNSRIILMHVLPLSVRSSKKDMEIRKEVIDLMQEINDKISQGGIAISKPILQYGNIVDRIIETADDADANVVLIGSGTVHENRTCRLSDNAMKIMRWSNKPVWVVKTDVAFRMRSIFCPIDFSAESRRALDNAIIMADRFNAKLHIFSVYELYTRNYSRFSDVINEKNNVVRARHEKLLSTFLNEFNLSGIDQETETIGGNPVAEIRKAILSYQPDLLIMGTSGRSGITKMLLGSVTERVTKEIPCPFVTLRSADLLSISKEQAVHRSDQRAY